jgi:hypothetical protein
MKKTRCKLSAANVLCYSLRVPLTPRRCRYEVLPIKNRPCHRVEYLIVAQGGFHVYGKNTHGYGIK